MGCFTSRKISDDVDETALSRTLLKIMCAWPENRNIYDQICGTYLRAGFFLMLISVTIFVSTEEANLLQKMQSLTDWLAFLSIITKDYYIRRNAHEILTIRKLVMEDFRSMEKSLNVRPVRSKRPYWPWIAVISMIPLVSISFVIIIYTMFGDRENRVTVMRVPTLFLRNDYIYFPFIITYLINHFGVWITYASADGLYISFTSVLRDKALTLNAAFKVASKCETPEETQKYVVQLIRYHQLVCKLHEITEFLTSGPALAQVMLVLVSTAILLIRLVSAQSDLPISEAMFALAYFAWVFGQLVNYCLLGDRVTETCLSIANAGYSAFMPGMQRAVAEQVQFSMMRAQRPLRMTAKKIIKLDKTTFISIVRRSYSFFSAMSRMK